MTILVLATIWIPVIYHFYVPNVVITDGILSKARSIPSDFVLDEIRPFFLLSENCDTQRLVDTAEKILQGEITYHGCIKRIKIPFDADDIDVGLPGWQLFLASFKIPRCLLNAYEVTARDDFLMTARDMILGWASYESNAWFPKGLLWNDHAIATRVSVLVKFWKHYRNHPEYDVDVARTIFQMVSRSGKLLAEPSHFTFNTNHGIMQNLSLWQICLAFPTLPNLELYKQIALDRMSDQMTFYINDEGVVLEHSGGYQRVGIELIGMVLRYLTLLHMQIPDDWKVKYQNAKNYYAQLRRPDGSLPMFGDTNNNKDSLGPLVTNVDANEISKILEYQKNWIPRQSNSVYPVAGYSIWWDGLDEWQNEDKLNQTVVSWSNFPGQAHKHADEMSVLLWAKGLTWITNVGYWTYGKKGRSEAVSWGGSNAPHIVGESAKSIRNTHLKYQGWSKHLAVIDLQRDGPQEYVARRQIIFLKPKLWIVVDNTSGDKNNRTTTTWTTSNDVKMSEGDIPGSFNFMGENSSVSLNAFFITSGGEKKRFYSGSYAPFAGWVQNKPADSIVIEQPVENSWSVAIWSLENTEIPSLQFTNQPYMQNWESPEEWRIVLPVETGLLNIWRVGDSVYVDKGIRSESTKGIKLIEAPDISDKYAELRTGYKNAASKYSTFNPLLSYRWRITYCLVFLFILQEVFFFIYSKVHRKHYVGFRMLTVLGWVSIIGLWFMIVYFKS